MDTIYEHIEALYNKGKKYTETSIELYKLNAIDTTADVVSSLASRITMFIVVSLFTLFVNIAIALFIGKLLEHIYLGFLIVSCFYLILSLLLAFFSDKLIKEPITNLVIAKLLKPRKTKFVDTNNN